MPISAHLTSILNLSSDAVCAFCAQQQLIWMNDTARRLFEYEDSTRLRFENVLQKDVGSLYHEILQATHDGNVYHDDHDVVGVRANGKIVPLEINARQEEGALFAFLKPRHLDLDDHPAIRSLAYKAGVGQITTGVLHNIGNILNSINISIQSIAAINKDSRVDNLQKANALFQEHLDDLSDYVTSDPAGRHLPDFYTNVGDFLQRNHQELKEELSQLESQLALIKNLIAVQQGFARRGVGAQHLPVGELIEDAVRVEQTALSKRNVHLEISAGDTVVQAERSKLLHVLINLIKNANEAMMNSERQPILRIQARRVDDKVDIIIQDNGLGVEPQHMDALFSYGFTTKTDGHGFGLYTCRESIREMDGEIEVESDGPDQGARFIITLPAA